jgi:hypothetical protein
MRGHSFFPWNRTDARYDSVPPPLCHLHTFVNRASVFQRNYGTTRMACMSCLKAKCKRVALSDGPGCQRCHRLKKPCETSGSVRRAAILNKQNSNTQIAKLAKNTDGLNERLESHNAADNDPHTEHQAIPTGQALDSGNVDSSGMPLLPRMSHKIVKTRIRTSTKTPRTVRWSPGLGVPLTAAFIRWNYAPDRMNLLLGVLIHLSWGVGLSQG